MSRLSKINIDFDLFEIKTTCFVDVVDMTPNLVLIYRRLLAGIHILSRKIAMCQRQFAHLTNPICAQNHYKPNWLIIWDIEP